MLALLFTHGPSLAVTLRLRRERDRDRIRTLLAISGDWLMPMTLALLAILVTGIVLGFTEHLWGEGWLWTSIVLLVVVSLVMSWLGTELYDKIRVVVGVDRVHMSKKERESERPPQGSDEELDALLTTGRPWLLLAIGSAGLLAILWLMIVKPF